jgi:hypothetical protein
MLIVFITACHCTGETLPVREVGTSDIELYYVLFEHFAQLLML